MLPYSHYTNKKTNLDVFATLMCLAAILVLTVNDLHVCFVVLCVIIAMCCRYVWNLLMRFK